MTTMKAYYLCAVVGLGHAVGGLQLKGALIRVLNRFI